MVAKAQWRSIKELKAKENGPPESRGAKKGMQKLMEVRGRKGKGGRKLVVMSYDADRWEIVRRGRKEEESGSAEEERRGVERQWWGDSWHREGSQGEAKQARGQMRRGRIENLPVIAPSFPGSSVPKTPLAKYTYALCTRKFTRCRISLLSVMGFLMTILQ